MRKLILIAHSHLWSFLNKKQAKNNVHYLQRKGNKTISFWQFGSPKGRNKMIDTYWWLPIQKPVHLAFSMFLWEQKPLTGDDLISREVAKSLSCQTETSLTQFLPRAKAAQMMGDSKLNETLFWASHTAPHEGCWYREDIYVIDLDKHFWELFTYIHQRSGSVQPRWLTIHTIHWFYLVACFQIWLL